MSEDPEETENKDDSQPEQSQPDTAEPSQLPVHPEDGSLSNFRQSLAEEEAADVAAKTQKVKRLGIIRRVTGLLNLGTGRADERDIPAAKESPIIGSGLPTDKDIDMALLVEKTSESHQVPEPDQSGESDNLDLDAKLAPLWSEPGPAGIETIAIEQTPQGVDQPVNDQPAITGEPEQTSPTGPTGDAETLEGDALAAKADNTSLPGGENLSAEGPITSPAESITAGEKPPAPSSEPGVMTSSEVTQPRRAPSLRRLVTGFLMPSRVQKKEEESEIMPDEQIAARLKSAPVDQAERPTVPLGKMGKPVVSDQDSAVVNEELPGETISEEGAKGLSPYSDAEVQTASEEDRSLWGAYVDHPSVIPVHPAEPSPFVDENLTHTVTPESGEPAGTELMVGSASGESPESPEINGPFVESASIENTDNPDTPWLGELRGEISAEDDLLAPLPVEEVDDQPEKLDIWDRLFAEQERGEQIDGTPRTRPLEHLTDQLYPDEARAAETAEPEETTPEEDIPTWAAAPQGTEWTEPAQEPTWSEDMRDKTTDGYGNWYEEGSEDDSGLLGLPGPSQEASEELKETNKIYDSIFEEQKQQEMRSVLLGEEAIAAARPAISPMPDFTEELEEPAEKPKPWWARLTIAQKVMIIIAVILVAAIIALTVFYYSPRPNIPEATIQPTAVQIDVNPAPNGPYPIGIELTGGWIFSLKSSTRVQGRWTPQGGEWLDGTQIRRVIALPWSRQTEAVARSFLPGDPIRLYFSNKQTIVFKVTEIKQVAVDDVSVMSDTHPSLAIILYQTASPQRWVVIATQ